MFTYAHSVIGHKMWGLHDLCYFPFLLLLCEKQKFIMLSVHVHPTKRVEQ